MLELGGGPNTAKRRCLAAHANQRKHEQVLSSPKPRMQCCAAQPNPCCATIHHAGHGWLALHPFVAMPPCSSAPLMVTPSAVTLASWNLLMLFLSR